MKAGFVFLLLTHLAVLPGWGAGLINLNNNFTPPGGASKAFVLGQDGQPMAKALGRVEVLDSTGALIRSGGFGANGLFFLGVTEIPGTVPGGSGEIIIRVWDSSTGGAWETATDRYVAHVSLYQLGGGGHPIRSLGTGSNFAGFPCLCPPWPVETWAVIGRLEFHGDFTIISGSSNPESFWALEWSEDLRRWSKVEDQPLQSAVLQWSIPKPRAAGGYFRVVLDP